MQEALFSVPEAEPINTMSSQERCRLAEVIANCRRRHAGLAHGVADLVKPDDDVAGSV
jgi:hypothetical protein